MSDPIRIRAECTRRQGRVPAADKGPMTTTGRRGRLFRRAEDELDDRNGRPQRGRARLVGRARGGGRRSPGPHPRTTRRQPPPTRSSPTTGPPSRSSRIRRRPPPPPRRGPVPPPRPTSTSPGAWTSTRPTSCCRSRSGPTGRPSPGPTGSLAKQYHPDRLVDLLPRRPGAGARPHGGDQRRPRHPAGPALPLSRAPGAARRPAEPVPGLASTRG